MGKTLNDLLEAWDTYEGDVDAFLDEWSILLGIVLR